MDIVKFSVDMQAQVNDFFKQCFSSVGIPYSPKDRHADVANVESHYMNNGCFWCLIDDNHVIGTIAIRKIDDTNRIAELKRMFVLPEFQGNGYGRLLLEYAIKSAREQGYQKICLDTRKQFSVAQHLYRSVGFRETERYNDNEHAELYFEMDL
ncbi:MAG: GNAT family N-acetyltransferase [Lachnospiraceae bacterium]|nr:GNAT family N-acetyltransferase [Lachnospiraceae bacterium]